MPCRSLSSQALRMACTLAFAALCPALADATPKLLDDAELSAVRGADGTILAGLQNAQNGQNPLASGLAAAFSSRTGATLLTPTEFVASLDSLGLSLDAMPDYHGESVAQTVVDARPVTFKFTLTDVLRSSTGLQFNSGGASFGTFTMTNFDARGTTLWVWQHH